MAFGLLSYCTMIHRRTRSAQAAPCAATLLEMNGLSAAQEQACYETREAFLERNGLNSWRLTVNLRPNGPAAWLLDISVEASADFDRQTRSTAISVDGTVDLAQVVDMCLETHYNACMNRKAMAQGAAQRSSRRAGQGLPHYLIAHA
jgi:hypothetical protein